MLTVLTIVSLLLLLISVITQIRNDFWLFKVFEYPRLQKLLVMATTIMGWVLLRQQMETFHYILMALLIAFALYYCLKVFPYSILWPKEIRRLPTGAKNTDLKIFSANVLQSNRNYAAMLAQIRSTQPDIIFLLETDAGWENAMRELQDQYPNKLLQPQGNTYGLLFYTHLKMVSGKVVFRVKYDVPSIEAILEMENRQQVKVWGLHPEPPVPSENMYATAKDKELMKVALLAREEPLPCVVFGDLNDVAWSHTTKLFRKTSGLLDPRIGRGFYSTFSAHHWWIRFPLDYIFCSPDFGLIDMQRMPKNGSDHFATFVHLGFEPQLEQKQSAPKASQEDLEEAKEMAAQPVKE